MLNSKKILTMARKCQEIAAISHKRIYFSGMKGGGRADKGHCVVYTADQRRYVIPLNYLNKRLFRELLRMAEEEYGLPSHHPITLPCDAVFMDSAIYLIRTDAANDLEKALLMPMHIGQSSSFLSSQQEKATTYPA